MQYDDRILTTTALLTEFFTLHNFSFDRGKGSGQYRSAILSLYDDRQLETARQMTGRLREAGFTPATDVGVVPAFYRAEARHQQYCSARGLSPDRRDDARIRALFSAPETTDASGNQSVG